MTIQCITERYSRITELAAIQFRAKGEEDARAATGEGLCGQGGPGRIQSQTQHPPPFAHELQESKSQEFPKGIFSEKLLIPGVRQQAAQSQA